jgi:hypothetical protein
MVDLEVVVGVDEGLDERERSGRRGTPSGLNRPSGTPQVLLTSHHELAG